MTKFVINNTTYRFNAAIGALIKVGTIKDLGKSDLHTPNLPDGVQLKGRQHVSSSELFHIGKKDANLNKDDVERLNNVRNGYYSHEMFLTNHPYYSKQDHRTKHTLYHSPNMKMSRQVRHFRGEGTFEKVKHLGLDSIDVSVDGRYTRDSSQAKKHIKELGNVSRAFKHFIKKPSGKRVFIASPAGNSVEEKQDKARMYQRIGGFSPVEEGNPNRVFANHGSPDHLRDEHNTIYSKAYNPNA